MAMRTGAAMGTGTGVLGIGIGGWRALRTSVCEMGKGVPDTKGRLRRGDEGMLIRGDLCVGAWALEVEDLRWEVIGCEKSICTCPSRRERVADRW